jgi:uncharacterized RDD family membrane protein YckC
MEEFEEEQEVIPVRYAAFWQRAVAYIIDALILIFPSMLVLVVCFYGFGISPQTKLYDQVQTVCNVLIAFLYFILMEGSGLRGTFGKLALGLYTADLYGNALSFRLAFYRNGVRWASYLIAIYGAFNFKELLDMVSLSKIGSDWYIAYSVIGVIAIFDYSSAIFTAYRQTMHDYVAGTVVLRR